LTTGYTLLLSDRNSATIEKRRRIYVQEMFRTREQKQIILAARTLNKLQVYTLQRIHTVKVPRISSARHNNKGTDNGQALWFAEAVSFKFKEKELNANSIIVK